MAYRNGVEYVTPERIGGAKCPACGAVCVKVDQTVIRTRTAVVRWHLCTCLVWGKKKDGSMGWVRKRFKSVEKIEEKGNFDRITG